VWRGPGTLEILERQVDAQLELADRFPDGFVALASLEHGVPFERNGALNERAAEVTPQFVGKLLRQAYVIPHAGFGGTMLRMTIRALMMVSSEIETKVFARLGPGLEWLASGSVELPEVAQLERSLPEALGLRQSTYA
jgi:hypothetical protein